jgi:hypothetical protein
VFAAALRAMAKDGHVTLIDRQPPGAPDNFIVDSSIVYKMCQFVVLKKTALNETVPGGLLPANAMRIVLKDSHIPAGWTLVDKAVIDMSVSTIFDGTFPVTTGGRRLFDLSNKRNSELNFFRSDAIVNTFSQIFIYGRQCAGLDENMIIDYLDKIVRVKDTNNITEELKEDVFGTTGILLITPAHDYKLLKNAFKPNLMESIIAADAIHRNTSKDKVRSTLTQPRHPSALTLFLRRRSPSSLARRPTPRTSRTSAC